MITSIETSTVDEQIARLEANINERQRDIGLLRDALAAVEAGKPRPQLPAADNIHALVLKMLGAVPQNLQEQEIYSAKLEAAKDALQLTVDYCREKTEALKVLRQQKRETQEAEAFEALKLKAEEFNNRIDEAVELLDSMRLLASQAGGRRLEVSSADLRELPYCSISENIVRIRRRFDVLQRG